jgi:chromosome segregation ATPase
VSETSALSARLIGEIFVARGLVTPEQLERALEIQSEEGGRLGEIIVTEFGVSRVEMAGVLAEQWAEMEKTDREERREVSHDESSPSTPEVAFPPGGGDFDDDQRPLGEIFVDRGYVTSDDLERALVEQQESGRRLGEILVEQGSISRLDLASALAEQWAGMQKLRPPAPKPATPWQQAPPEELVAAQAAARRDDSAELEEVRQALASLEARVRTAETAASDEAAAVPEELAEYTRSLEERVAALETRTPEEQHDAVGVDELRATLAELHARLRVPEERLAGIEEQLAAAAPAEAVEERLRGEIAELGSRLDALTGSLSDTSGLDELRNGLAALDERLQAGGEQVASVGGMVDRLGRALEALGQRIDMVERRAQEMRQQEDAGALGARVDDVAAEVGARLDAVTARLGELEARPVESSRDDAALRELHAALAEVRQQSAAPEARLDELASRLSALESAAHEPRHEHGALDELRGSVSGLEARLAEPVQRVEALERRLEGLGDSGARVDAVAADVAARLDAVTARLDELDARPVEAPRDDAALGELRVALAEVRQLAAAPEARLEEITGRLSALESALHERSHDTAALDELRAGLTEVRHDVAAPLSRLDALEVRLAGLASVDDVEGRLRQGLSEVASRIDALGAAAAAPDALDAVQGEIARLDERLRSDDVRRSELEGAVGGLSRSADDLGGRLRSTEEALAALAHRIEAQPHHHDDVEGLREELTRTEERSSSRLAEISAAIGAQVDALTRRVEELAAAEETGASAAARHLAELRQELTARVDALAAEHARGADVDVLRDDLSHAVARLDTFVTEEQLAGLSTGLPSMEELDGVRGELESLRADLSRAVRFDEAEKLVTGFASEVQGLTERILACEAAAARMPAAGSLEAQIDATIAELEQHLTGVIERSVHEGAGRLAELKAALEGFRAAQVEQHEAVERALHERAGSQELAGLVARVDELGSVAGRLEALEAASGRREDIDAVAERLGQIEARLEGGATQAELNTLAGDLRAQLSAAEDRLGSSSAHVESQLADGAERVETVRAGLERLAGSVEALRSEHSEQEQRVGELVRAATADVRTELDELRAIFTGRDEEHHRLAGQLARRVEELVTGHDAERSGTRERLEELGSGIESLRSAAEALRTELLGEVEASRAGMVDVTDRIDDAARRSAANVAEATAHVQGELDTLATRFEEAEAARGVELDEALRRAESGVDELRTLVEKATASSDGEREAISAELQRISASLGWRLEQLEQALAGGEAHEELRSRIDDVERRLEDEASQREEQTRVTERAVRKGLAALGARLAETDAAYQQAGGALRRSIERLGHAIVEADVRSAERSDEELVELHHRVSTSYVAFAPTAEGYRLIAVDAAPPAVGEVVGLDGQPAPLRVSRVGVSPLPFDTRPCAYLEPATDGNPPSERPLPE